MKDRGFSLDRFLKGLRVSRVAVPDDDPHEAPAVARKRPGVFSRACRRGEPAAFVQPVLRGGRIHHQAAFAPMAGQRRRI